MRAERSLPAGLGLPPASRENGLALWEQTEDSVGGGGCPQIRSSTIPLALSRAGSTRGSRVWGPGLRSTGPQGPDRREEAGRANTEGL